MRGSAARAEDFPSSTEAAQLYAGDMGSTLTADSVFGRDPFPSEVAMNACQASFHEQVSEHLVTSRCKWRLCTNTRRTDDSRPHTETCIILSVNRLYIVLS